MQGFNMGRYIPPEAADPGLAASGSRPSSSLLHGSKRRAAAAAPVVRFEMPFAVWCAHCPAPTLIGQGVRFNAEKRRAGSYFSTPVWSFRMRHAECGGAIEVRTDPRNSEFVVVSGARRRDYGAPEEQGDGGGGGGGAAAFRIVTPRERAEQRESAFGKLEKTIADREQVRGATQRIGELRDAADRLWDDPYAQNQRLRRAFRADRHRREREAAGAEALKERMGLGIELLPEAEEDSLRAKLVDFGSVDADAAGAAGGVDRALARPLFSKDGTDRRGNNNNKKKTKTAGHSGQPAEGARKLKSELAASRARESLVAEIVSNTRAARDPFLDLGSRESTPRGPARLPGLKRKRPVEEAPDPPRSPGDKDFTQAPAGRTGLVSYDSDSEPE